MTTTVRLEGMEFHAFHGVYEDEKKHGAPFSVDVSFEYDARQAVLSDQLEHALDYSAVFELVKSEMAKPSDLLEHVAGRIVNRITSTFPNVSALRVRLVKLKPPIEGFNGVISVELTA